MSTRSRPAWLALAAAVVPGLFLRLDQFIDQVLIDDEWHAVHQLILHGPSRFLLSHGHSDHSIPLTAWDWLLMQSIGLSELGMRLPLLLAGLASLLLLPLALRGRLDLRVLLVFVLLLSVSTLLVGYARMARPYALTLLLSIASLALLARAVQGGLCWPSALAAAVLAALSAWLHSVCAPFVLAPLLALGLQRLRGRGLCWRDWLALVAVYAVLMTLAVLPPLLGDMASLTGKAGRDLPRLSTLRGVWYIWLGTSSTPVVLLSLALAALGFGSVWRSGVVPRWTLLGLGLTLLAILVVRPAWVFNPLTFGRYLLPALPLLLLCVAAGLVRAGDRLFANAGLTTRAWGVAGLAAALAVVTLLNSPQPALLRHPNSNTLHYLYQFDYRPRHNPVVAAFDAVAISPYWATLAAQPPGSLTIALAPFRFESPAWLGPRWEGASRQWVIPAYLSGSCVDWLYGEVPPDHRFAFRNAVHLADDAALRARGVDVVALHRDGQVLDSHGRWRKVPECEAWMRERFGTPAFEDAEVLVWNLR